MHFWELLILNPNYWLALVINKIIDILQYYRYSSTLNGCVKKKTHTSIERVHETKITPICVFACHIGFTAVIHTFRRAKRYSSAARIRRRQRTHLTHYCHVCDMCWLRGPTAQALDDRCGIYSSRHNNVGSLQLDMRPVWIYSHEYIARTQHTHTHTHQLTSTRVRLV